jgi:hypothetical protein
MGAIASTTHTLTSAVADDATFTLAYPTGTTQATLLGTTGGQMVRDNDMSYAQGSSGFTASFGASNITVTNTTGASLPAGAVLIFSFGSNTNSGSYMPAIKRPGPAALTAATGTASDTIADVGASFNQTTLNNNMKSLADKLNAVIAALDNASITV